MKKLFAIFAVVFCFFMAASCAPKDCEKAKAKLEKAEYSVTVVESGVALSLAQVFAGEELKGIVTAAKDSESVVAYLYESSKIAKSKVDAIKEEKPDTTVKQSGKWVVSGSEAGIKAFLK